MGGKDGREGDSIGCNWLEWIEGWVVACFLHTYIHTLTRILSVPLCWARVGM